MKKIRFSLKVISIFMKNQIQDKTNLILDIFNMVSRCFIVFLLYAYIFKINGGMVNSVDYKTTMWSMFIYFVIMTFNIRRLDNVIMMDVKSGNVEMFLNKPISYLLLSFFKVIGMGLFSFIFIGIIGSIIMLASLGFPSVNVALFIPTFVITLVLGQILGLLIYGFIGVLAFFIENIRPVHWIVDKLVMVLGGSYLPITMFPPIVKAFAYASPFGAINFATSTVFDSWNATWMIRIGIQVVWIIIFTIILAITYSKAKKNAMINGG